MCYDKDLENLIVHQYTMRHWRHFERHIRKYMRDKYNINVLPFKCHDNQYYLDYHVPCYTDKDQTYTEKLLQDRKKIIELVSCMKSVKIVRDIAKEHGLRYFQLSIDQPVEDLSNLYL